MSGLGAQTLINQERAFYLSSIPTDVIHGNVICDTLIASQGYISTLYSDNTNVSTLNASTLNLTTSDVSGMYVSSLRGNTAFFSTLTLASDLSGGVGYVRFTVDASGIQVDGDPIRFDNLVYLTSTINIIQVSTLVDTDIFAQNGFFSTFSTGSLSTGVGKISSLRVEDLSANYGAFNTLYVSSLEALDISGVVEDRWSLYPTLNSSIIFQPGNVLSNVGNRLYFAGQELTDASGGGIDWSYFPALQDVSMNNFSLRQISTLQFQDSARLYSQTGNNLFYNGQPIQYGSASNVSQWANFPAVAQVNMNNNNITNANGISTLNLSISNQLYNNDYTWLNTLEVGGTSFTPLMAVTSGGDVVCRNLQVGDAVTGLADVNIYGATALPGDNALYVEGGVTLDGGTIHGFTAGCLPVAGINTCRIDILQAGFNLLTPLVGAITTGAALGITAGGALSLAGGGYVEVNTSTIQCINTTQGNKNTTLQTGFITIDPDLAATSSVKLFNVLGGGVEIDGGGQGSLIGFSTVRGSNLSSINLDVSTINGIPLAQIQTPSNILCSNITVGASTITSTLVTWGRGTISSLLYNECFGVSSTFLKGRIQELDVLSNINGIAFPSLPIQAQITNFSSINSFNVSTTDLWVSSINGQDISGNFPVVSSFNTLKTSSFLTSSLIGYPNPTGFLGSTVKVQNSLQFEGGPTWISSMLTLNNTKQTTQFNFSTLDLSYQSGINPLGFIRIGGGGAFDAYFQEYPNGTGLSTQTLLAKSTIAQQITTSSLRSFGGLSVNLESDLQFEVLGGINNLNTINLNPAQIPVLTLNASTINLQTSNVRTNSLSTIQISTSALQFSTATSVGSNTAFNYPILLDYDQGGSFTNTAGVAIAVQGHNYPAAAISRIEMGARGNGENYIMSIWPGANLEDLYIDSTEVIFRDGTFSTIVNLDPYGLITTGAISAPSILVSSINNITASTQGLFVSTINGLPAKPAFTNNLMLSTMELYAASTTLMYWDSTTTSSNINTTAYDAVVGVPGAYKIGASFQFISGGTADEVEFFILKNNSVISQSGGIVEVENNQELVTYVESIESLVNGDAIQIGCYTANSNVFVSTINGNIIQSPACILTMYRVDTV